MSDEAGNHASIPPYASLPRSIDGEKIFEAIKKSGYPFQAEVANTLRANLSELGPFSIQEEWAYIDSDTSQTRSIDVLANVTIKSPTQEQEHESLIHPSVSLLVECKQSDMPYVFFLRESYPTQTFSFPEIAGLPHTDIRLFGVISKGEERIPPFLLSIHDLVGCQHHSFFNTPTPFAVSFAKSMLRGSKLEISGDETYRGITLPLIKASEHLKKVLAPNSTQKAYTLRFIVCLAVLRAPMIGAYVHNGKQLLIGLPWVRTFRMDPTTDPERATFSTEDRNIFYYDVVHESFLPQYLEVLKRDMTAISAEIHTKHQIIATGIGMQRAEKSELGRFTAVGDDELEKFDLTLEPAGRMTVLSEPLTFDISPDIEGIADGQLIWLDGDEFYILDED
ncbi:hypothetical protein AB0O28_31180 [Microbispora sp. NPDC088329]|uniref:hypothetical protein n=1 Tax=Microbispora sp. NPDC088329 TaxID=3154869 RepID=UPI00342D08F4